MTSSPASSQVGAGPGPGRGFPGAGLPGPPTSSPPLWPAEVTPTPLEELRAHKALAKLRGRQEREMRELIKKQQRKAATLTRRLLHSLAQARAGIL